MVQNVNNQVQTNQFGSINRIGTDPNGRGIYQVTDPSGKEAVKMSVAQKDCDVFEKSYKDIIEAAPQIQKYAEKHSSPKDVEKRKSLSKWIIGLCGVAGAGIPIYLTRKLTCKFATALQALATVAGLAVGLAGGAVASMKITTPPGSMKFAKASQNLSKLDIQPYTELPQ